MREATVRVEIESEAGMHVIRQRYLLVCPIPCYVDADGSLWLDRLWHRDFVRHLTYLSRLTLAAPTLPKPVAPDLVRVEVPPGVDLCLVALPSQESSRRALLNLAHTIRVLWRAIGACEIVHSGVDGWPFPLGWIANPIAVVRRKTLVIVVESAPWRLAGIANPRWHQRVRAAVTETLARWSVRRARVSFFTHLGYRNTLTRRARGLSVVTPASWIDEQDVLTDAEARSVWREKTRPDADPALLFVGALEENKGVGVLLHTLRLLDEQGRSPRMEIMGNGRLRDACAEVADRLRSIRLRLLDPVPYGPDLFRRIRTAWAIVVPSLSDEQPRIVYDAFSQAVPILASSTAGLAACVTDGFTGRLFDRGDADALSAILEWAWTHPASLEELGMNALRAARRTTHQAMHANRSRVLSSVLGGLAPS